MKRPSGTVVNPKNSSKWNFVSLEVLLSENNSSNGTTKIRDKHWPYEPKPSGVG